MTWDLQLNSPLTTPDLSYRLAGSVHARGNDEGASVRVQSLETGWAEEVFLNAAGEFELLLDLAPNSGHVYELNICDSAGRVATCTRIRIQHHSGGSGDIGEGTTTPAGRQTRDYANVLEPPWPVCVQRIRDCLHLAATVAQATGRNRDELLHYVYAQERYAEQANKENNRTLYQECLENLDKYAAYLEQVREAAQPRPLQTPPPLGCEDPREKVEHLRTALAALWKEVRARRRTDLEGKLKEVAGHAQGLGQRCKADSGGALEEARRLLSEIDIIRQHLRSGAHERTDDPTATEFHTDRA